jgi:hypothetical protein
LAPYTYANVEVPTSLPVEDPIANLFMMINEVKEVPRRDGSSTAVNFVNPEGKAAKT